MVTELLVPEKVNIMWSSQRFKGQCQLKEKWFGTSYSCEGTIMYIHCTLWCHCLWCHCLWCHCLWCHCLWCHCLYWSTNHYYADSGPCIIKFYATYIYRKKHLLFHYLDIPDEWKDEWESEYNNALKLCTCVDYFQFHYNIITFILYCSVCCTLNFCSAVDTEVHPDLHLPQPNPFIGSLMQPGRLCQVTFRLHWLYQFVWIFSPPATDFKVKSPASEVSKARVALHGYRPISMQGESQAMSLHIVTVPSGTEGMWTG